jgi:hypothetical protein
MTPAAKFATSFASVFATGVNDTGGPFYSRPTDLLMEKGLMDAARR